METIGYVILWKVNDHYKKEYWSNLSKKIYQSKSSAQEALVQLKKNSPGCTYSIHEVYWNNEKGSVLC